MWKMLGLLGVGLAAGAAILLFTRDEPAESSLLVTQADSQNVDVQRTLAALDRRVRQLSAQVEALQEGSGRPAGPPQGDRQAGGNGPRRGNDWQGGQPTEEQVAAMRERRAEMERERERRDNDRIRAAGLTPERLQEINLRTEAIRVAAMQAQYQAQQTGQRVDGVNVEQALRKELGDSEYEKYLRATGRPTDVRVMDVLATSNAERAGLRPGDEIVSYNGTRVFDSRDLNTLTNQASAGGNVVVEVKRDGQVMQVSVPRGPLGLTAGAGGGGRGGGGPPGDRQGGGFRGGGGGNR